MASLQQNESGNATSQDSDYIPYEFKSFDSVAALRKYTKSQGYMRDSQHPGICFGFGISENGPADFEVTLTFDDRAEVFST